MIDQRFLAFCLIFLSMISWRLLAENKLPVDQQGPWVVLTSYDDKSKVLALREEFDLWKIDEKNQTVLMMVNHLDDYQELIDRGFEVNVHQQLMDKYAALKANNWQAIRTIPGFSCYRTVDETFAAMSAMQSNYPQLVTLVDIGDSWHKANAGGLPGYDMQVVKITNQTIVDPNKPILYAMGSIHAREYPPAELVTRFAEHLLSEYNSDPDVTWLVDHHEIHLLLQGNPDGRIISEGEPSPNQRKNRNENYCLGGNQQGVDMNRNFAFKWNEGECGFGGCSSGEFCSQVFRGENPVSEPETQAINSYIQTLFPDERIDDLITPAPLNKPGVYLDIHNVAELILFPFGYEDNAPQAPNHVQLQTLGRRMGFYTGYRAEQSSASLGGADGASDDNAYGTLGVAAYTIELGEGGFYSSCTSFENTIWPDNLKALIYAAKASRMPYVIASGPDVINLPTMPLQVEVGQNISLNGTATDLQFNNNNGTEPTQSITGVNAYIDVPPWSASANPIAMTASDGSFNNGSEEFAGLIESTGLSEGRYTIWFVATDTSGISGVPSAIFVEVVNPGDLATLSGVVTDAISGQPIPMASLAYAELQVQSNVAGEYIVQTATTTDDLFISKLGYTPQIVENLSIVEGQVTTQNIQLQPTCNLLSDDVDSYMDINQAIAAGWSLITAAGMNDWSVVAGDDQSSGTGKAFVAADVDTVTDKSLVSPVVNLGDDGELIFWHKHQFESNNDNYDGGVIEISTNGADNWADLGNQITQNGYNGLLNGGFDQPLGRVNAFVDSLGTFTEVKVDLSAYANQEVRIRWRMGTDNVTGAGDWKIDDIQINASNGCPGPTDVIFVTSFE